MNESLESVWESFANENNGTFQIISPKIFQTSITIEGVEVMLCTYKKGLSTSNNTRTQISCRITPTPTLQFKVRHQGLFNRIFVLFGMQDLEIEDPYFDDNFVIQGNNEEQVLALLREETIKNFLPKSYELVFQLKGNKLEYRCRGLIKESTMLTCLHSLMKNTIIYLKKENYINS